LAICLLLILLQLTFLNLNEFPITDTELTLMAAAAIRGDSKIPKKGNNIPAATGCLNCLMPLPANL
jgi:hypothetical protein